MENIEKIRTVMIGTPTYDGKITVQYAHALKETILLGINFSVKVVPVYIAYNALVQLARNDLFKLAYEANVDDLFFIDSDIGWNEKDFFKLLNRNVHIVGGTYRKKTDNEEKYAINVEDIKKIKIREDQLIEVDGIGMGFCRIDNYAIKKIWKNSKKYVENNEIKKAIFNVELKADRLISEDISFCEKWTLLKEKIYLDPSFILAHVGVKEFYGNFSEYLNRLKL